MAAAPNAPMLFSVARRDNWLFSVIGYFSRMGTCFEDCLLGGRNVVHGGDAVEVRYATDRNFLKRRVL